MAKRKAFPIHRGATKQLPIGSSDWATFAEVRQDWGYGIQKTRELLRHGISSGEFEVMVGQRPDITGKPNRTVLYRPKR